MFNKCLLSVLVTFGVLFLTACGESQQDQSHSDHMLRAQVYQEQGQYKAAIIEFKNAVKKSNGDISVILSYAKMLNRLGQYPAALGLLEQVKDNKNEEYYIQLVRTYQGMNKYFSSQKLIAEQLQSDSSVVKILKADNALGMGEHLTALKIYEQLISDPLFKNEALLGKATALARLDKFSESLATIELIDKTHSIAIKGDILKAGIQIGSQGLESAEATLSSALSAMKNTDMMEPEKAVVLERLAYVLTRQGRSNEAYIYNKILSEAFPGSNEVKTQFQSAVQKMDEGDLDGAKDGLSKILKEYPEYSRAKQLLGVISYLQGDINTASEYLSESVDPEVANDITRHIYAATNLQLNDPGKVLEILEPGIDQTKNASTLALYGLAAISDKQFEKGESALLKAIELDGKNIRVRLALANYYRNKQAPSLPKEKEQLDAAYATSPTDKQAITDMTSFIIRNKGVAEAEAFLSAALVKYPNDYANNFLMGSFIAGQNKFQAALDYFERAHKVAKEDIDKLNALSGVGRAQLALKDKAAAEKTFDSMIKQYPDNLMGYKGVFSVYLTDQDFDTAFKKLEQYGEQTGKIAPYSILIEAAVARQDLVAAKAYLEKLKALNVNEQELNRLYQGIRYVEAVMAMQVRDYSEARSIAADLLSDNAENLKLLSFLVDVEMQAGQLNEAAKILAQIENINPDHPVVNIFKADLAIAKNDMNSASNHLSKAWQKFPSDNVAEKLFKILGAMKDTESQQKHLNNWLEVLPGSPVATLYQAIGFQQTMQKTKAIEAYEKVLEKIPNNVMALNNLGWIYFEKNDDRALPTLKKAVELAPENAAVLDSYGWVLAKSGNKSEGLKYLEKAHKLSPDEAEIKAHLDEVKAM